MLQNKFFRERQKSKQAKTKEREGNWLVGFVTSKQASLITIFIPSCICKVGSAFIIEKQWFWYRDPCKSDEAVVDMGLLWVYYQVQQETNVLILYPRYGV